MRKVELDECRENILNNILPIQNFVATKTDSPDSTWLALLIDTSVSIAAIKQMPTSIPVIALALMNVINALDSHMQATDNNNLRMFLFSVQKSLADATDESVSRLVILHGKRISPSEAKVAQDFISSIQWNSELKEFLATK